MDVAGWLDRLTRDGEAMTAAVALAGWDTPVPGLEWSVRELFVHTGAVHRWSADIVRRRLATNETGGSRAFHPDLPDDELVPWFAAGLRALVADLRAAPVDLRVWAFFRQAPAQTFWSRRQAHEISIHRVDAEAAAGLPFTPVEAEFAQDGLAELAGFARGFTAPGPGRLGLLAADGPDWLIRFDAGGDGRIDAAPAAAAVDPDVDATVSGTSAELYRWAWNRPADVVVAGDPAVAARWAQVRIS